MRGRKDVGVEGTVSAGGDYTCCIRSDDAIVCWGSNASGQASPPSGTFKAISVGFEHTCAVRVDRPVACWGNDDFGQSTPTP